MFDHNRKRSPIHPDLPYMSINEYGMMKRDIRTGRLTIFRLGICQHCDKDVVKGKKFCSLKCFNSYNGLPTVERLRKILKRKRCLK